MIIVVDAYNLLHAMPPYKKTITDKERAQFIAQLSVYGHRKGHKIVIVFDGGPHEWPFKERMKTVVVVYSGIHESADDYIKEYVEAHKAKDLLLVSSDAELNRFAERLNIPSIDSSGFYQLLRQELTASHASTAHQKQDQVVTIMHDNIEESLDDVMLQASKMVPVKSEDFMHEKKRTDKSIRSKKHERALLKKLNKL